ncbi:hypothetical protein BOSE62_110557 [Bosea sp. 62]|nr:hypothetical protein BOSE21B_50020 [Bosea sp. 21B]CAD5286217.1 hypothetical protein BOSE46_70019 [Bosea sp. 46]CAD5301822.1 hypothetical protein BOSE7B_90668 [Bosea sp. 7B]VVT51726.1 hypothetical protein BOS5A_110429 [Bosea sp. EC-HK365B]VXB17240.1 hypothetical protein BOSE62_110557 [Bosea sp. 62]VXB78531.1 hypothetical protein BOSE127_140612 [Bosea sp. 127]VXC51864.1 hypothetical protein BOSE29B_50019 [Bosea sp. 29B]VXC87884.1 hypothetical protein BOSE125_70084 [Bosea sp. 125]
MAILALAAHAPKAHGSVLNTYDLARNGVEIVLAGPTQESFRQTALTAQHLTVVPVDCPDPDGLPPEHAAHVYAKQVGRGAAFVCLHGCCLPPVTDPNRLAEVVANARRATTDIDNKKGPGIAPGPFEIAEVMIAVRCSSSRRIRSSAWSGAACPKGTRSRPAGPSD